MTTLGGFHALKNTFGKRGYTGAGLRLVPGGNCGEVSSSPNRSSVSERKGLPRMAGGDKGKGVSGYTTTSVAEDRLVELCSYLLRLAQGCREVWFAPTSPQGVSVHFQIHHGEVLPCIHLVVQLQQPLCFPGGCPRNTTGQGCVCETRYI